jgi:hypothetical protein
MDTPSFKEDHISQMLVNMGYSYLINQNMHNKLNRFIVHKQHYSYGI